jgi:flavin reductase (DIM6/NTAB) family NADH-FMN oxidoreductase RutF
VELDPLSLEERERYKLIIGCVVPRPIAWVSTCDTEGRNNLAPFSFFNAVGSTPPAVTISVNYAGAREDGSKDTLRNILELGEFVVNMVTEDNVVAMNETATNYPREVDEFVAADLTPLPSVCVRPPRVAESPINFECTLHTTVPLGEGPGSSTIIVGIIRHMHIRDDLINERNYIDLARYKPVARLAGNKYAYVHETFELARKVL